MKRRISPILLTILAIGLFGQALMQGLFVYPKWSKDYAPKKNSMENSAALDPDQFLFALIGFRELIAGILWVRADSFFDTGNYDAILPIVRLVTILDPHQLDVYATGMWHIGYNFTDEEQRSDRRYIPSALALGKEGARNNPETYELYFETGWIWYHKIDDYYDNAVEWFESARQKPDMLEARKNLLGMAYQREGEVEKAKDMYATLYQNAVQLYKEHPDVYQNRQNRDTIENNLDTTMVRMAQRGEIAREQHRSDAAYDTSPPFDVGFSVKATVVEPRVIRFEGTWNVLPVGTRIRVVLKDEVFPSGPNIPKSLPAAMDWDAQNSVMLDPPKELTFMQDQLFVRNRKFNKKVDMSKDPTMYPFSTDRYLLEFYYNPRSAPPHIQDKFSWNGEGMTDKNFLDLEARKGQRVVYTTLDLTKDQILRRGEWRDKVPVVKTKNFVETGTSTSDDVVLDIPSLRAGSK
jgi:hypothetical protein